MNKTKLLEIKNSFVRGMGSVIFVNNENTKRKEFYTDDWRALAADWETVGKDMWEALDEFNQTTQK